MASTPQPPKGRDVVIPTLDVFIQALSVAKDTCGIPPAQIAFGSACTLLTMIRVRSPQPVQTNISFTPTQDTLANYQDYVDLGRNCADVCQILHRRLKGKTLEELKQAVLDAIGDLTT